MLILSCRYLPRLRTYILQAHSLCSKLMRNILSSSSLLFFSRYAIESASGPSPVTETPDGPLKISSVDLGGRLIVTLAC